MTGPMIVKPSDGPFDLEAILGNLRPDEKWAKQRVVIGGVPRARKTTLSTFIGEAGAPVLRHTDDLIESHGWSEASAEVATWFDVPGPWVIEGVATIRALRKWMKRHDNDLDAPCDVLIWMPRPVEELEGGRASLAKGCCTVYAEIASDLEDRGVEIVMLFR